MINQPIQIFHYDIRNNADKTLDLHIDSDIVDASSQQLMKDWFGDETSTSFRSLRMQIEDAKPSTINLYINSPGGHVGDAMAIHDYLKELESKGTTVNRRGRGIIASAATYILMGKNSEMSENSFFMIHNVKGGAWGDVNQVESQGRTMRKFNDRITDFYVGETGRAKESVEDWMNKETFMTAKEAKENGFIKNITGEVKLDPIPENKWMFNNTAILNKYNSLTNTNPQNMDFAKFKESVENNFKTLFGILNKDTNDQQVNDAMKAFTDSIVNAVKEISTPSITEDKIKELINSTIEEKKFVPETAITDFVKKDELSNYAAKSDIVTFKDNILNGVAESLGNKSSEKPSEESKVRKNGKLKNEFSDIPASEWQVKDPV